jgi:hypothetical protein
MAILHFPLSILIVPYVLPVQLEALIDFYPA